jgi:ribosome-binding protein aMBF1 (putative translation factor)
MPSYRKLSKPAEIIAQARQELGLNQSELARRLQYSNVNFISMLEAERSKVPLERAVDIAEALEIDARWFVEKVMRDRYPNISEVIFKPGRKS